MESTAIRRASADGPTPTTVLLVTDDDALRAVAGRVLAREGYQVVGAPHSGHAILAGLTSGPIDIVATEMSMHDMSGPALAGRLRRLHPDLRAIYFADEGTPERAGVLVRPFTRDDLLAELHAIA